MRLVRRLYHEFRQFKTVDYLKERFTIEWEYSNSGTNLEYVDSIPIRCRDVVLAHGGPNNTGYSYKFFKVVSYFHFARN